MARSLRDTLPEAHRRLLPLVYDRPQVLERRATCESCAMCAAPGAGGNEDAIAFGPNLKCCTYHPTLPSFLVGAILADTSPEMAEGRRRIRERIASRIGVTPQWLSPSRKHRVLLDASRTTSFGRSKVLLCPYFEESGGGLCTIWRHRESVCSTFFCKHEAGAAGHAFWTANKKLLGHVEVALAKHAAGAISGDLAEPSFPRLRLTLEDLEDRAPSEGDYVACWGPWVGREEEVYLRAHAIVAALTPSEVEAILAADHQTAGLVTAMEECHEVIAAPRIAERLVQNRQMRITPMPGGSVGVTTYSMYDPMSLTPEVLAVLGEFRVDETVSETRARLRREQGLEIEDALLLVLQNHAILIPPP